MLHAFPIYQLVWPTAFIAGVGLFVSYAYTRRALLSYAIAIIKAGLFMLYFGVLFNGTYTFFDDWNYFNIGRRLAHDNIGILNFVSHYDQVVHTVTGWNVAYYVYNATAMEIFGIGYYAPVALNVVLTFLAAGLLMKAARIGLGMSDRTSVGLFVFLALSPDILAWSTIPNLKDTLVATATAAVVYAVALMSERRVWRAILVAAAGACVLAVTRLYVPLMLGMAFMVTLGLSPRGRRSPWLWLFAICGLAAAVHVLGHGSLLGAVHTLRSKMDNPLVGVLRFTLTPIPFHTDTGYGFLDIPQLVYWLLLPLMVYGIWVVWKKATIAARFMVIYFLAMILLYGSFTLLQGPRHRVQIDGLVVIFQYYGVLALLRKRFRIKQHAMAIRSLKLYQTVGGRAVASFDDDDDAGAARPGYRDWIAPAGGTK
ncbi:MAG: hypothetical protein ACREPY_00445 [Rhodanobacteraceae bacterium]